MLLLKVRAYGDVKEDSAERTVRSQEEGSVKRMERIAL
jgi:hypothetical protein